MANKKNILVNGTISFPCPIEATIDQAKIEIRSRYGLQFGGLEDSNGALMDGSVLIGATVGAISFVAGQPIQGMKSYSNFYMKNNSYEKVK